MRSISYMPSDEMAGGAMRRVPIQQGGRQMRKRSMVILLFVLTAVLAAGCGERKRRVTDGSDVYVRQQQVKSQEKPEDKEQEQEEPEDKEQEPQEIYAVTAIDLERQTLTLRNCKNAVEIAYEYTGGTYVRDKYEHNLTMGQLSVGELVTIEQQGEKLSAVQIAKDAFSYDDL